MHTHKRLRWYPRGTELPVCITAVDACGRELGNLKGIGGAVSCGIAPLNAITSLVAGAPGPASSVGGSPCQKRTIVIPKRTFGKKKVDAKINTGQPEGLFYK